MLGAEPACHPRPGAARPWPETEMVGESETKRDRLGETEMRGTETETAETEAVKDGGGLRVDSAQAIYLVQRTLGASAKGRHPLPI